MITAKSKMETVLKLSFIFSIISPGIVHAKARHWQLKELAAMSDVVAVIKVKQVVRDKDNLNCDLSVEKYYKTAYSAKKQLSVTMQYRSPLMRPVPVNFEVGERHLVFLTGKDEEVPGTNLLLLTPTSGAIHLQGDKNINHYILDGAPSKEVKLNEIELIKRIQQLIGEKKSISKTHDPKGTDTSILKLPIACVDGQMDIGGKYLSEILNSKDISNVVILNNGTSAPDELHLYTIDSILKANPYVQSYFFRVKTGSITRSYKSQLKVFFTVLFAMKNGEYIGFELGQNRSRVFNKNGDGWVVIQRKPVKSKS